MAGIYIHIPFCKKKCSYCDFHFSTSLKYQSEMVQALQKELILRVDELHEPIETIYFGGGTPSICTLDELAEILNTIYKYYQVQPTIECTLEANPDDLDKSKIQALCALGFNRLSIGVQSFFEEDLQLMNRSHSAQQSIKVIENAQQFFENISIDLIYSIPKTTLNHWKENVQRALELGVPHISSYALTVEKQTALSHWVTNKKITMPQEEQVHQQFLWLVETMKQNDFVHYELSNFGKEGFFSQNNTAYWQGKPYLGIGPSAHSFNGTQRSWNVANNTKYIKSIQENKLPSEQEQLSINDRYNEYIMTGLRTMWGVSLQKIKQDFGQEYVDFALQNAQKYIHNHQLECIDDTLKATLQGKFLTDGISADLFRI